MKTMSFLPVSARLLLIVLVEIDTRGSKNIAPSVVSVTPPGELSPFNADAWSGTLGGMVEVQERGRQRRRPIRLDFYVWTTVYV
ncbi:hypothetical protein BC835DRAFT_1379433 [Cytidiella melzeri]|nr:hypothetical protein BC835DRAFT_1379433 [Cytidiella melzeri]